MTRMIEPVLTLDTLLRSISVRAPDATAVVAPGRVALDFAGLERLGACLAGTPRATPVP